MKANVIIILSFIFLCSYASDKNESDTLKVISYNIRYYNSTDGANIWENRQQWACDLIKFYEVDFVGAQEVVKNQLLNILSGLPNFKSIGVGRIDGKEKGEYCPVFYNKDKFKEIKSSTFWLSEKPDTPGKGWDAAYERVVTWAEFKSMKSGKTFFVFNTHFDHMGEVARRESAVLIKTKIKEIAGKKLAIIMGDLNTIEDSQPYKILTSDENPLFDTHKLATFTYGPAWTFHGFGSVPEKERVKIDFVFVNQKDAVKITKSAVIAEQRGELYPSDHCPLFVEMIFK